MPHEKIAILDIVRMLMDGTKNGSIKWEAESPDGDSFRTNFNAGGVRLSSTISFSGSGGPLLVELLDPRGHSIFQFRPQTQDHLTLVHELFGFARNQALNLDQTIDALVEEIRKRSEKQ